MILNSDELDDLFRSYGFTPKTPRERVRVYLRTEGYFQNAEIVPLEPSVNVDDIRDDYEQSGFACKVSRFQSVEQAEMLLFNGFFQQQATAERLGREYAEFCEKITRSLGSKYEYVDVPYLMNGRVTSDSKTAAEAIKECLGRPGPVLVFLEAAAGFGKTCTAFELLHHFLWASPKRNPIFAELSRNRQARIFKYVLYDEMYRNYRACGLSPEMVEKEIKSGRIPLIVDGFDELLHLDRDGDSAGKFAEVEPMLLTLSGILESEAKILVTTRRTAVLGASFDEWMQELVNQGASAYRFTLQEPRIEDWIGQSRRRELEECGFPLRALANPVLLAFIRALSDEIFRKWCEQPTGLVRKYFETLLDRERVRQELPISATSQMTILRSVADAMLSSGSSALPREELLQLILERHHDTLRDALRAAPEIAARTPEELADKLTDHAFFDRKASAVEGIGFVNDFVAGTLLGQAMLERGEGDWFDESEMDKAVTAFQFREEPDRKALWGRLREMSEAVDESWQVRFDLQLIGEVQRSLSECVVQDLLFEGGQIGGEHRVEGVIFMRCTFDGVRFVAAGLDNVGFVDCVLRACVLDGAFGPSSVWFDRDCSEFGGTVISAPRLEVADEVGPEEGPEDYERLVLQQFWPQGRPHARPVLQVRTLYQGTAAKDRSVVALAIAGLRDRGLISVTDRLAILDRGRMAEIRRVLGR